MVTLKKLIEITPVPTNESKEKYMKKYEEKYEEL